MSTQSLTPIQLMRLALSGPGVAPAGADQTAKTAPTPMFPAAPPGPAIPPGYELRHRPDGSPIAIPKGTRLVGPTNIPEPPTFGFTLPFQQMQMKAGVLEEPKPFEMPKPVIPPDMPSLDLGAFPTLEAPAPHGMYQGLNVDAIMKDAADAFAVPELQKLPDLPEAPMPRDTTGIFDSYVGMMGANKPKDTRESEVDFKNHQFADALSAAALASIQGSDLGSVIAAAGGAFGGSAKESREARKLEGQAYDEALRQFDIQMAQLNMEADLHRADYESAVDTATYQRSMDAYNQKLVEINRLAEREAAVRQAKQQMLGIKLDTLQHNNEIGNKNVDVKAMNDQQLVEFHNQQTLAKMPELKSFSPDGTKAYVIEVDPATGKRHMVEKPMGAMGMVNQLDQMAQVVGGAAGDAMKRQSRYELTQKVAPQFLHKQVLSDLIDSGYAESLLTGRPPGFKDSLYDTLGIQNPYQMAVQQVQKTLDPLIASGQITPEEGKRRAQDLMLMMLEPFLTPEVLGRAKNIPDFPSDLKYGMSLLAR